MVGYSSNRHSRPMLEAFPVKLIHFMPLRRIQLFNSSIHPFPSNQSQRSNYEMQFERTTVSEKCIEWFALQVQACKCRV